MMKKYAFLTAAIILSLALTGCNGGKKADKPTDAPQETAADIADTADTTGTNTAAKYDENFTDADKDVDMKAIKGDAAKVADDSDAKGSVNGAEIKIGDAKIVEYDDQKAIVVSLEFKNNSGSNASLNGLAKFTASQDDSELIAASFAAEGYVPETYIQTVASGGTITVQRAFDLFDDELPVTVTVEHPFDPYGNEQITKTFNID